MSVTGNDFRLPTCCQVPTRVRVLAHRGCWAERDERNTLAALTAALTQGDGVETDVRDLGGTLVISHDPPGHGALPLETFFAHYASLGATSCLALNIKSDGLAESLQRLLLRYAIRRYFVFDMSIPDTLGYLKSGLRVFARQSDLETQVPCYEACQGIWLDAFQHDWYSADTIVQHVNRGKEVAVVSPELHGRSPEGVWRMLRQLPEEVAQNVLVCTDFSSAF